MNFKPCNRHILLSQNKKVQQEDDNKPTILVPDDYKVKMNPHGIYKVASVSEDCVKISSKDVGNDVLVSESMVETISVSGVELLLVLENHIYGVFE